MSPRRLRTLRSPPSASARPLAVIELGTSSIRLAVAQADARGHIRLLDSFQRSVALGKDAFTLGTLRPETAEECVNVLRAFAGTLREYGVAPADVSAVATSAVREAANRDAFLDRLFIATDLTVRCLDEAEVNRYTYMAAHPLFESHPELRKGDTLIVEVGGGSTEVLELRDGQVTQSRAYRLGSLRLRSTLSEERVSSARLMDLLQNQVDHTIRRAERSPDRFDRLSLVTLGGDIRLAASRLVPNSDRETLARLNVNLLTRFTQDILQRSIEDVAKRCRVSYPDAETLGAALLVYCRLAAAFGLKQVLVGRASLRDGILQEMAAPESWSEEFKQQVITSAFEIGKKYEMDRAHAEQVAILSRQLFGALRDEHRLDPRSELLLITAALLHEVGGFVSNRSHHKHSMYLILNSDIFGLGATDRLLTALIARYHRHALPKPVHEGYAGLSRDQRVLILKLAAILRVADALTRGGQEHRRLSAAVGPEAVTIALEGTGNLTVEEHALRLKGDLFEQVYGKRLILRAAGKEARYAAR